MDIWLFCARGISRIGNIGPSRLYLCAMALSSGMPKAVLSDYIFISSNNIWSLNTYLSSQKTANYGYLLFGYLLFGLR